jgi:hypothetical protein
MTYTAAALTYSINDESILKSHGALLKQFTGHLLEDDLEYFLKWDRLIDLEADAEHAQVSTAWLIESEKRERETGKCVSSLVFDEENSRDKEYAESYSWYAILSFQRSKNSILQTCLSNLGLEPGCHVIVSEDRAIGRKTPLCGQAPRMHIVRGFLHRATDTRVEVRASRDDLARIRTFLKSSFGDVPMLFRLDRDDGAWGTGTLRQNLVNLFTGGIRTSNDSATLLPPARLTALRDRVVRLCAPIYDERVSDSMFNPHVSLPSLPGCDMMDLAFEFSELNPDQQAAAEKVTVLFCFVSAAVALS